MSVYVYTYTLYADLLSTFQYNHLFMTIAIAASWWRHSG